jgi:hypothetical protein
MKKIFLAFLFTATAFAVEPVQHDFTCTFTSRTYQNLGGNQWQQTEEKNISLPLHPTPGQELTQELSDHLLTVFVCNTNPVTEVDVIIKDFNDNRVGITIAHLSSPYFGHWTEIKLDQDRKLELGVSCGQVK